MVKSKLANNAKAKRKKVVFDPVLTSTTEMDRSHTYSIPNQLSIRKSSKGNNDVNIRDLNVQLKPKMRKTAEIEKIDIDSEDE